MKNIEFSNCMQVIGIFGILPNRVCARSNISMDLQISNNFPSETEKLGSVHFEGGYDDEQYRLYSLKQLLKDMLARFETEKIGWVDFEGGGYAGFNNINGLDPGICFSGTDMLKWFNHQSVDNSIFFSVGRNFPKFVVCIVPGPEGFVGFVEISINGYENRVYQCFDLVEGEYLFSLTQWSLLQIHLNESNPTEQNLVKVSIRCKSDDTCYSVKMWGVHVECTCPPQEDDAVDYGYSIKG